MTALAQHRGGIVRSHGRPPGDLAIRPDQHGTALVDLTHRSPSGVLGRDDDHGDREPARLRRLVGRLLPGRSAGRADEQREPMGRHGVERGPGLLRRAPRAALQPDMGQVVPWAGGRLVDDRLVGSCRRRRPVRDQGSSRVEEARFHVELAVVLGVVRDGVGHERSPLLALGGVRHEDLDLAPALLLGLARLEAQSTPDRGVATGVLQRVGRVEGGDRAPFGFVGVQQRVAGLALEDRRELPGQVVGVLDSGIEAEAPGGRVPVGRVAGQEGRTHPEALCHNAFELPVTHRVQRHRVLGRHAQHLAGSGEGGLLVGEGRLAGPSVDGDQPLGRLPAVLPGPRACRTPTGRPPPQGWMKWASSASGSDHIDRSVLT